MLLRPHLFFILPMYDCIGSPQTYPLLPLIFHLLQQLTAELASLLHSRIACDSKNGCVAARMIFR